MSPELPPGARRITQQGSTFYVVGEEAAPLRDAYHTFLKAPWWASLCLIAIGFFIANLVFAAIYMAVGGVEGTDGTFFDALSFSIQTMATIGYGVMHPTSHGASAVMIAESMFGIVVTALATGLVFAKFSRPTTRIAFSRSAVITAFEGKPTLMFRVGNRRGNIIVEAKLHLVAITTTTTQEGETFYRASDLRLVRDRQVGMTRGWTVMHVIDEASPLHGLDQAGLAKAELELHAVVTGTDDVTMQTVHAMHSYDDTMVRLGYRFEDTLRTLPNGEYVVDLGKFDAVVPDTTARVSVPA
jgi:inward rectifier potassium channel